jgi:hypothetical protein
VPVPVAVAVAVDVIVGVAVRVAVGRAVVVKKRDDDTPHWSALFLPRTVSKCRPGARLPLSSCAEILTIAAPKFPLMEVAGSLSGLPSIV